MMAMGADWSAMAKGILRSEMTRRGVAYKDLAKLLSDAGEMENEANLRNKVSRGAFTAAFFLQCLSVMGCHVVRLDEQ